MKHYLAGSRLGLALVVSFTTLSGLAQMSPTNSDSSLDSVEFNFHRGWHEASFGAGTFFSNIVRADNRPNIDYTVAYANVGYVVTKPGGGGPFRGSLEVAPEIFGGAIYNGPGSYVAGATLWFRYNFVQPGWPVVPYLAAGGGGTFLDIPDSFDGKMFNFNLDAAVGLRYFIRPKLSLNAEYRLQHISNADLWSHNVGVNADGPFLGVSLFF